MVEHVLDLATIAVGTKRGAAAGHNVEGTAVHLASHQTNHQTRTEVGGDTVERITETSTESMVVTILGEAIKRCVNRHF
jgi:hypothetical protein